MLVLTENETTTLISYSPTFLEVRNSDRNHNRLFWKNRKR